MQQDVKLSAAKDTMDQMMTALTKDFHSNVDGLVYLCTQQEAKLSAAKDKIEAKLSAAKDKMDQMMTALKKDFHSTLDEKDAEVCALEEEIRGFQCVADQPRVLQLCKYDRLWH